jgi:transcriptional regulator with XRE-family HTH domain
MSGTNIGQRVRLLREAREWSLAKLSSATGISKAYLVRVETGRPSIPNLSLATVDRLASALDAAPAWIAYGSVGDPEPVRRIAAALNAEPGLNIDYLAVLESGPGEGSEER